jgi:large subunit ribosomal protein L13
VKKMQPATKTSGAAIINGEGLILGRMCSQVAKRILNGEEIIIVNAEKVILSGKRQSKIAEAHVFLEVGAPDRGPFHSRRPDRIVGKTVRGMVPWKLPKGKTAYKRLKVFLGVPVELKDQKMETFENASVNKLKGPRLTLGELAEQIGWNKGA